MECCEKDTWKVHHKILFRLKLPSTKLTFLMQRKIADESNKFFTNIRTDLTNKIPNTSKPFKANTSMESQPLLINELKGVFFSLKEVRYNCSVHRSAHLFIIAISSHSYIRRKQRQITFLQYSCSVTMIYIVKKYL